MQGVYQSKQGEQQLPSSVLKDQSCGTAENRGLLCWEKDWWSWLARNLFLSNPRKELSVTWCSHSSVTFSSLLILWYICLLYFWTLVFISSMMLWVLVLHRIILILCCGTSSYAPGRTSVTDTNCCLTFLKDPHSSITPQVWYISVPTNLTAGSWIHLLQPVSGLGTETSAVFKNKRIQNFALK